MDETTNDDGSRDSNGSAAPMELEPLGGGSEPSTAPRMLIPLFVVPMIIVAVIVGIFFGVGALVGEPSTPEELVARIEGGGVNERWQAAAALIDQVTRTPELTEDSRLRDRLRRALENSNAADLRLRQCLARLCSIFGDKEASPVIIESLQGALRAYDAGAGSQEDEVYQAVIWFAQSAGSLGDLDALDPLVVLAEHSDPGFRQAGAVALGDLALARLEAQESVPPKLLQTLTGLHDDAESWVRMNAALSLAKAGSPAGLPTLEFMLSRENLAGQGLQFPDDGSVSVERADPAALCLMYALVSIERLVELDALEAGSSRDPLEEAVLEASRDPHPEVAKLAARVLDRLRGKSV